MVVINKTFGKRISCDWVSLIEMRIPCTRRSSLKVLFTIHMRTSLLRQVPVTSLPHLRGFDNTFYSRDYIVTVTEWKKFK
jgi:hypothetical protein